MKFPVPILWFLSLLPCLAELPPSVYAGLQKKSPEKIEIRVDRVKHQGWFRKSETVWATVTRVVRSRSHLKAGDKIEIRYRHVPLNGAAGPSPIPRLERGKTYPAWLKKGDTGIYVPSARGKSFSRMK